MQTEKKTLIEVFPDWLTGGGIFDALDSLEVPWAESDISALLDTEYYGNVSGDKLISPLVQKILTNGTLSESDITLLANTIVALNGVNWAKEWATLSAQYDPIENYSMLEVMTNDETVTEYGKTHTRTDNTTQEETPDITVENDNAVYGFNSSQAVPTGEQSQGTSGTNTITNTGTVTDADSGEDTHTRNYRLTRTGNIGVTTSQQMLESERKLWLWNFFREIVFPDVDRILTLRIY